MDWSTAASLATAFGTLVLAFATFAAVRSANRAARATERSLLVGLRPVLTPTRFTDPPEKIGFVDGHWVTANGGRGVAELTENVIYLAIAVRNVGNGLAVLHGWTLHGNTRYGDVPHDDPASFRRLTRDLYIPPGDSGMWQGALRDPSEPLFAEARDAINATQPVTIELLYGDQDGGQRAITRFSLMPRESGERIAVVSRHWHLDRPDPR